MTARTASKATWLFGPLACLIVSAALLELSLPVLNSRYTGHFRLTIPAPGVTVEEARRFLGSNAFDPELGWNKDPRNYVSTKRYIAQSYGDSFVEGVGVGPEDTWQAHFERLTGEAILNLGVGGYGLDQAVLKFEKYASQYPTRIALLGLYPQMFRRVLSYHSFYYFPKKDFTFAFKPIFVKRGDRFEQIRPPCSDAACLVNVLSNPDHEVRQLIARYDYWYQLNQRKPVSGFPNTINYARMLPDVLRERHSRGGDHSYTDGLPGEGYFFPTSDSLDLVEYLIERFVNDSRRMGMMPLCVLLYSGDDLGAIKGGDRFNDKLLKFLAAKEIAYVDTASYILDHYRQSDRFESLNLSDRHLNSRGNLLVAEALARELGSMALLGR